MQFVLKKLFQDILKAQNFRTVVFNSYLGIASDLSVKNLSNNFKSLHSTFLFN